jgi:uncharacterized protein (UPF0276 family)
MQHGRRRTGTEIPRSTCAGVGLRSPHITQVLARRPAVSWFEVHAENYFADGPEVLQLELIRRDYPISLHGVGLSLGGAEGLDSRHIKQLTNLAARIEPSLISEHLAWSSSGETYLNDLLPLPLSEETLLVVCQNIDCVQDALGRAILVENPSSYIRFVDSPFDEPEFLNEVARRTGCAILCDVNNVYVTSENFEFSPAEYIDALDPAFIGEIHLGGHYRTQRDGVTLLIDDHGAPVASAVWDLYSHAIPLCQCDVRHLEPSIYRAYR